MMIDLRREDDPTRGDPFYTGIPVESLTRTDAFLLLLEAQNHVLFRESEWHWAARGTGADKDADFEASARIVARTARTFQDAMYRLRQDGREINLSPGVARSFASGGAGRLR